MKSKFSVFILLVCLILGLSFKANSQSNTIDTQSFKVAMNRIQSVENGLKKSIQIKGSEAPGMNIYDRMKYHNVPGVSIAIINDGKIEWAKTYSISPNETINTQTLFQAASISKPFTATIALSLVEKNKINLDQNINNVLKTWKIPENQYTEKEIVNLRRLLSHTAGLTVSGFIGYSSLSNDIPTLETILNGEKPANSDPVVVANIPGSQFSYSGGGYLVVQKAIEDITQKKFDELAHEIIFRPLDMKLSSFGLMWPNSKANPIADGHLENGDVVIGNWYLYPESAAAGLWTTPSDLARFTIEIQNSFDGKLNRLLTRDVVKQMLSSQTNSRFGLGFVINKLNRDVIEFSHSGANVGYQCFLLGFTNSGLGAVIMTNSDNGFRLIVELIRSIADTYHWPDGYTEQYKIVEPVNIDPSIYYKYAGQFVINGPRPGESINLFLSVENDKFYITMPYPTSTSQNKTFELTPESETTFFTTDGDFEIIFAPKNNDEFTLRGTKAHRVEKEKH